jgi:purine-nucleoside phosphorylase
MSEFINLSEIDRAVEVIQRQISVKPRVGMILGSGLGPLAEKVEDAVIIPYGDIPAWPVSTVEGHHGRLVIGMLEGQAVLVMQGRAHYYEGYSMPQVGFPVRVMQRLGLEILIVTNAAGAVNPEFEPGEVMLITDHLNLLGMAGESPLRGPNKF